MGTLILLHIIFEKWGITMNMKRMRMLRIKAGYRIKDAAEYLDIKPCTLRKIERGQAKPSPFLKLKMSVLYKCDIDEL
jgi:DNA-binding XRE family transcriptional regulator